MTEQAKGSYEIALAIVEPMRKPLGPVWAERLVNDIAAAIRLDRAERNVPPPESAEIARLRAGITAYLEGNYDNPRKARPHKCRHNHSYWETCEACVDQHFLRLLDEAPK